MIAPRTVVGLHTGKKLSVGARRCLAACCLRKIFVLMCAGAVEPQTQSGVGVHVPRSNRSHLSIE